MAAAGSPVQDLCDEATCSICLEYFKDPVTTAECGHNFCRSCLVQCCGARGRQASCPQCRETVQKRNLIPNRQLAHLVELIKELSLQREEEEGGRKGRVCEKHQEPLNLFCEDHESPICVVCEKSKMHENHKVIPLEEAFEEYKGLIRSLLEILMKEKEKILAYQADLDKESQDLLKLTETGRQKTVEKFRQLQQFLKEQEKHHLGHIEEVEKEIARKRNEQLARLSRERVFLEKVVQEMEEKRLQPANELLQDVRSTLQRYEKRETLVNPLSFPPELKGRISEFCDINPLLEDVMKQFKDALLLREQLQKEVLSFGKPQKEGRQRAAMEVQDLAGAGAVGAGAAEPRDPLNELPQSSWQLKSQLDTLAGALGEHRLHLEGERTFRASKMYVFNPPRYSGEPEEYPAFKTEALYFLDLNSGEFETDQKRVAYLISLLEGDAKLWAIHTLMAREHSALSNLGEFLEMMDSMFQNPLLNDMAAEQLLNLRQGSDSVSTYWTSFSSLVQRLGWQANSPPLAALYRKGLNESVLDELSRMAPLESLDDLVRASLQIGLRQQLRMLEKRWQGQPMFVRSHIPRMPEQRAGSTPTLEGSPEPMQLGSAGRVTPEAAWMEGGRCRRETRRCFACGKAGHLARQCPSKKAGGSHRRLPVHVPAL
nr:uncharacterized protein LOC118081201 isoform X1 [Zootoca vivipara]